MAAKPTRPVPTPNDPFANNQLVRGGIQKPKPKPKPKAKAKAKAKTQIDYVHSQQYQVDAVMGVDPQSGYAAWKGSSSGSDIPGAGVNYGGLSQSQQQALYGIKSDLGRIPIALRSDQMVFVNKKTGKQLTAKDLKGQQKQSGLFGLGSFMHDPNYTKTAQLTTFSDAWKKFQDMDPSSLAALQQQMQNAGLLVGTKNNPLTLGAMTPATENAYQNLLQIAARNQEPLDKVLEDYQTGKRKAPVNPGGDAPLQIQLTNPDDLRQAALSAGQQLLGRDPDEGFINNFIGSFHSAETHAQQANYSGGSYTAPASAENAAIAAVRKQKPAEEQAFATETGIQTLRKLVGGTHG